MLADPAYDFSSTRDIDQFLDCNNEKYMDRGYLCAIRFLALWLSRDIPWDVKKDASRGTCNEGLVAALEDFYPDLSDTLGVVGPYVSEAIGPSWSRFDNVKDGRGGENGIWKYSPFLCGAGLMEALEIGYRVGMGVWERRSEPLVSDRPEVDQRFLLFVQGIATDL